jgi:hypothetical protein
MNRNSGRLIWCRSIAQLDFPKCPAYMTEPAYAHVAFEPVCRVSIQSHLLEYHLRLLRLDLRKSCRGFRYLGILWPILQ